MKKRLVIALLFVGLLLNGCVALDIADIFLEETPVHSGEVQSVTRAKDKTTILFVDGVGYEINKYVYVRPGDNVKIFKKEPGEYSADVE